VNCADDGSELHLITEGEHALDRCIADELCLAGSPQSAAKESDSVQRMLTWLNEITVPASDAITPVGEGSDVVSSEQDDLPSDDTAAIDSTTDEQGAEPSTPISEDQSGADGSPETTDTVGDAAVSTAAAPTAAVSTNTG